MDLNKLVADLAARPGVEESYPFGPEAQVFKVMDKMFALIGYRNGEDYINLKASPDNVLFLTEQYLGISPGYHMNKRHWISVQLSDKEAQSMLKGLVDDSYQLVASKLTKVQKAQLALK